MDINGLCERAFHLLETKQAFEAKLLFQQILQENPNYIHAKYGLGISQLKTGEIIYAEKSLREVIEQVSDHYKAAYYLGLVLEKQHRIPEAIEFWGYATSLSSNIPQAREKLEKYGVKPSVPKKNYSESRKDFQTHDEKYGDSKGDIRKEINLNSQEPGDVIRQANQRLLSTIHIPLLSIIIVFVITIFEPALRFLYFLTILPVVYWISTSALTHFTLYEYKLEIKKLEIKKGFLGQIIVSVWLYEIGDINYSRSPFHFLTNDAKISITTTHNKKIDILGFGNSKAMLWLYHYLDNTSRHIKLTDGRIVVQS